MHATHSQSHQTQGRTQAEAQRTQCIWAHTPARSQTRPRSRSHAQAHAGTCTHTGADIAQHNTQEKRTPPRGYPAVPPPRCTLQSGPERCGWLKLVVGGTVRAKAVWASPGGGSRRMLRSASPLKNPPAEEADVGVARPMAAARLRRLEDVSQSERQSWFRPIDGRRARRRPRRTRCPLPARLPALQPQRPPQPQPQRDARPWRRGTGDHCAGARALGSLAPRSAALPWEGRGDPGLSWPTRSARGACAAPPGAPAHHAPAVAAQRAPLRLLPADLSHPVQRQLPVSAAGHTRGGRVGAPSLGSSTGTGRAGNAAVRSLGGAPGARRARERGHYGSSSRPKPPKLSSWGSAEAVRSSGFEVRERVAR